MTITLLHGWAVDPDNEAKWEQFRAELQRKGYQTKFLPLPGLSTPLTTAWNLDDYVEWVHQQLGSTKKCVLLGHSFGGQIATRFAAQYPKQVSALILLDSAGIRDRSPLVVAKRVLFQWMATLGKQVTRHPFLRTLLYKLAREQDYLVASPVLRQTMRAVLADEVLQDLPKITAPTCIIWGEQDRATPISLAFRFNERIRNSQLHVISGARHSPQFTHPRIVSEYIAAFLQAEHIAARSNV